MYAIFWIIVPRNPNNKKRNEELIDDTVAGKVSLAVEKKVTNEMKAKKTSGKKALKKREPINEDKGNQRIIVAIALILFNIIFMLGIFLGMAALLIGIFAAGLGGIVAGVVTLAASIMALAGTELFTLGIHPGAGIFISIGIASLGLLVLIAAWYLSKLFFHLTTLYVRFNVDLIRR